MTRTLMALVAIAAISLTSWGTVRSQQMDASAQSVDERQIVVAGYNWDDKQHHMSLADLNAIIAELSVSSQQNYKTKASKAKYLKEFLEEKLKLLAAAEKGLDKDEGFLKTAEDYKHQIMVAHLKQLEIDEKIAYTEEDLRRYYEDHKDEFVGPEEFRPLCISLRDEDRAREVLELIKGGVDIAEMAKELSENDELEGPGSYDKENPGFIDFIDRELGVNLPDFKDFVDVLFELEVGEITQEVIEVKVRGFAFYVIFRNEEHRPEGQRAFDQVKDKIEEIIEREKRRERIEEWVGAVTTKSKLKTYPERIPEPPLEEAAAEGGEALEAGGTVIAEFEWDGKHQITLEDMMQELGELLEYKREDYKDKAGLEKYMHLMAESRVMVYLARDRKFDEDPEILKATQDHLNELLVDRITQLEVDEKLNLTEEDYRRYYESNTAKYTEPEQVRLTCVTVRSERLAKEAFQQIRDGRDIAEVAKELSDRGTLAGYGPGTNISDPGVATFHRDSYPPAAAHFVEAAFALEVGQTHDEIVKVELEGKKFYMIFRKEELIPARLKSFDEKRVHRSAERYTEYETRQQMLKDWIDGLYERANLQIYTDRIPD